MVKGAKIKASKSTHLLEYTCWSLISKPSFQAKALSDLQSPLTFQTSWLLAKKQGFFAPLFFTTSSNEKKPNTLNRLGSYFLQFQTWFSPLCVPALELQMTLQFWFTTRILNILDPIYPKQIWPFFEEDWQAQTQANFSRNFPWSICGRKLWRTNLCYIMFLYRQILLQNMFSCFQVWNLHLSYISYTDGYEWQGLWITGCYLRINYLFTS